MENDLYAQIQLKMIWEAFENFTTSNVGNN